MYADTRRDEMIWIERMLTRRTRCGSTRSAATASANRSTPLASRSGSRSSRCSPRGWRRGNCPRCRGGSRRSPPRSCSPRPASSARRSSSKRACGPRRPRCRSRSSTISTRRRPRRRLRRPEPKRTLGGRERSNRCCGCRAAPAELALHEDRHDRSALDADHPRQCSRSTSPRKAHGDDFALIRA